MFRIKPGGCRSIASFRASLMAAALFIGLSSCATPTQEADPMFEDAPSATAGITGKRDKLLGKPGQALPMQPVRAISFDTDEGSLLSLDVSP